MVPVVRRPPTEDHRDLGYCFDRLSEWAVVGLGAARSTAGVRYPVLAGRGRRRARHRAVCSGQVGAHHAVADLDRVEAACCQRGSAGDAFLHHEVALDGIGDADACAHRKAGADRAAHGLRRRRGRSDRGAPHCAASTGRRAGSRVGRGELREQIAVAAMQVHAVDGGFGRAARAASAKAAITRLDVILRHLPGRAAEDLRSASPTARPARYPASPIGCRRATARRRSGRHARGPRRSGAAKPGTRWSA